MHVERSVMSEQAQGETKWRLVELALARVHHGHASAVSLRHQQKKMAHNQLGRLHRIFVVQKTSSLQARVDNFVHQP